MNADKCQIEKQEDTLVVRLNYTKSVQLGNEYIASITALRTLDTLTRLNNKADIKAISVLIKTSQEEKFQYGIPYLKTAEVGMEITSLFLGNMLSGTSEKNALFVDLDKVSLAELYQLNTVNEQLQSSMQVNSIHFDGFSSHLSDPYVIEYRANLMAKDEEIPVVFHYDSRTKKIFYFGINEQ